MDAITESLMKEAGNYGRRSVDAPPPRVNPREILAGELEKERSLLAAADPARRGLHEGNVKAIETELSGKDGGVGGTSGTGAGTKPVMGSATPSQSTDRITASLLHEAEGKVVVPVVSRETSLSDKPRDVLSKLSGDPAKRFMENQIQPSDVAGAVVRGVRGVGAGILGGFEGLRQLANGYGLDAAADAVRSTVERGAGQAETQGEKKISQVMQHPLNPITWPALVGKAAGDAMQSGITKAGGGFGDILSMLPI